MTGLIPIPAVVAAAQSRGPGSLGSLSAVQFLLLFVATGFLLYVFAGHKQPSRVLAGLMCIGAAAVACAAFLFLPLGPDRSERSPSGIARDNHASRDASTLDDAFHRNATPTEVSTETEGTESKIVSEPSEANVTPASKEPRPADSAPTGTAARPAWVDEPPLTTSASGSYREVVGSGQYAAWKESQWALDHKIAAAVDEYLQRLEFASPGFSNSPLSKSFIEERIVKQTYSERTQSPRAGEMFEIYALLEFDDAVRSDLKQSLATHYQSFQQRERLVGIACLAGLILAFIGAIYAYLKLDTATKGYYSGRLKLSLALVTMTIIAGVSFVLNEIRWDAQLPTGLQENSQRMGT